MGLALSNFFCTFFLTVQSPLVRTINEHDDDYCYIQILATSVSPNRNFKIPYYISSDPILMKSFAFGSINNNVTHVP